MANSVTGAEIINNMKGEIPELRGWVPTEEQQLFRFEDTYVKVKYDNDGLTEGNKLGLFINHKTHYYKRMPDICNTINYFLEYFDEEKELYYSVMKVKFIIDQKPNLNISAFRKHVLRQVVTPTFVANIKRMAAHLYTLNIDTDEEGKYRNTPKITNIQARMCVAVCFAIRCLLPLLIHFADTNTHFVGKKDYIPAFDKIITKMIRKFEKDDIELLNPLCRFTEYRIDKAYKTDIGICIKKKQLYGTTKEIYLEEMIHEVVLVKSLYKLDYWRSVVSYIDGVIFRYHYNYKIENFKVKPVEIDSEDNVNGDDEHVSHAEAIEMATYRVDESNALIRDVNTKEVIRKIRKNFNVDITPEEFKFYRDRVKITPINQFLLEEFYDRFFHDSDAIANIGLDVAIELLIYMKKYLQLRGMVLIPQFCTAKIHGKYKENVIKNARFLEKITTSSVWNNVIEKTYSYVGEIDPKEHPIIKKLSAFVNSTFELIDYDTDNNGVLYEDIDQDRIILEFSLLLSIA